MRNLKILEIFYDLHTNMKYFILTLILILSVIQICPVFAEPVENEYGIVNAWYNDNEATVENVTLKINEPAEIKIQITSKIEGDLAFLLTNPMLTKPYYTIEGPSEFEEWFIEYEVGPSWTKTYVWKIAPNDKWINGNAPINVLVQINDGMDYKKIQFTIANPYILDEHYSGHAPTRTTSDPSSTNQSQSQGSPGFGVAGAMLGIMLAVVHRAGRA